MKKFIAILLIISIIYAFAACAKNNQTAEESTTKAASKTTESATNDESKAEIDTQGKKILTIYFSSANTTSADIVSSATPDFNGSSSTGYIAEYIQKRVGGDIAKITPKNDYSTDYRGTADKAKDERDNDERPEFLPIDVNVEDYDVIFIGYPVWWYTLPMVLYTFFDKYDLSDKTIIPFNTHEGSGDGGTYETIKEFEKGATVLEGFNVRGSNANKVDGDIDAWLGKIGF